MFTACVFGLVLLTNAICMPHFIELDDEEKQLYRAAYETYEQELDEHIETEPVGILTPKDSIWLMKAKLKEVKEFMRALAANLLSTKLKIKELVKKHSLNHHKYTDKKPTYNYQPHQHAPTYEPAPYGYDGYQNYY